MITVDKAVEINKENYDESFKKIILSSFLETTNVISIDDDDIIFYDYKIDNFLKLLGCNGETIKFIDLSNAIVVEEDEAVLIFTDI